MNANLAAILRGIHRAAVLSTICVSTAVAGLAVAEETRSSGPARIALRDGAPVAVVAAVAPATRATIGSSVEAARLPDSKRSEPGLYATAKEAAALLAANPEFLLIDVRTRAEVAFLGMPVAAAANIPYMLVGDEWRFDARRGTYLLTPNPDFGAAVERFLAARKLDRSATIFLICRSGSRSAKAASHLGRLGYANVYTVVDGYEGDKGTGGARDVNGWKNERLAWSYRLRPEQVYDNPSF